MRKVVSHFRIRSPCIQSKPDVTLDGSIGQEGKHALSFFSKPKEEKNLLVQMKDAASFSVV